MKPESGLTAQEYGDILNLYACYNHCSDAGDSSGYAACFSEDGELSLEPLGFSARSRASLEDYKRKEYSARGDITRQHWNSGIHLERLPDGTVRGRCYFHAYNGRPGELPVLADTGAYEDIIVQEDGAWRFARRLVRLQGSTFRPPR